MNTMLTILYLLGWVTALSTIGLMLASAFELLELSSSTILILLVGSGALLRMKPAKQLEY